MANKFYHYVADDGVSIGIAVEENVMALYDSIVKTKTATGDTGPAATPTAYDDLAALQVAIPAAVAKPQTLQPRNLRLQIPGFGTATMPVLSNQPVDADDDASAFPGDFDQTLIQAGNLSSGASALPAEGSTEDDLEVLIVGYQGEARLS